jgi:hypothetical protein
MSQGEIRMEITEQVGGARVSFEVVVRADIDPVKLAAIAADVMARLRAASEEGAAS